MPTDEAPAAPPAPAAPAVLPPAPAAPPAPAQGRATTTQDLKGKQPPAAPAAKAAASSANEAAFGRKTPAVRVTYLGPKEPVVICGTPPMRWQKGVPTREVREFWDLKEGLQFETITLGEVQLVPEDSPRATQPAFKVERLA